MDYRLSISEVLNNSFENLEKYKIGAQKQATDHGFGKNAARLRVNKTRMFRFFLKMSFERSSYLKKHIV